MKGRTHCSVFCCFSISLLAVYSHLVSLENVFDIIRTWFKKLMCTYLIWMSRVICPRVNLCFGLTLRSAAFCQAWGNEWRMSEDRKGDMERGRRISAGLRFIYKAQRGKKPSLQSQKGKDGLPSLKWHSHVLPASCVLSLELEGGAERKNCWWKIP